MCHFVKKEQKTEKKKENINSSMYHFDIVINIFIFLFCYSRIILLTKRLSEEKMKMPVTAHTYIVHI